MYNPNTEVLFPLRTAQFLKELRGDLWNELVNRVTNENIEFIEKLAFSWMMVHLCNCVSCNADSFRATRGCINCSSQTIRRFHGDDKDLIKVYQDSCLEVEKHLKIPRKRKVNNLS